MRISKKRIPPRGWLPLAAAAIIVLAALLGGCARKTRKTEGDTMRIHERTDETVIDEGSERPAPQGEPVLVLEANGRRFTAVPEQNEAAKAFLEKLSREPLTVELHDYGNFEKVGALPWELPASDTRITTAPGDIILYQGNQITVYYDVNTWSFTKLAVIRNATRELLLEAFGDGNVTVRFWAEWPE